ncbi:thymidylate synthase [Psychrobacter urativorans]|uniref:thymidylate synthase n=1 Tax=Psychrobacter urativorans TaxID=45610 RepID=UPI00191AB5A1|nr:thymidylate synthase [Psychrobacter urativorans]
MEYFVGDNYSKTYYSALKAFSSDSTLTESRVGDCYDLSTAMFSIRSLSCGLPFVKGRGLNIFFAIMEVAWIYSGSNELKPLQTIIDNYGKYSEDNIHLYGAYGYRIFNKFGVNQVEKVIKELLDSPESRRAVISIYAAGDLNNLTSLDIPCNISLLFKIRDNQLDMTVLNRSNDVYKGVPYNLFVFRLIQFYISRELDIQVGLHNHFTDSLHLYKEDFPKVANLLKQDEIVKDNLELDVSFFNEIIIDSANIVGLNWNSIKSKRLRWLFTSYREFKEIKNISSFEGHNEFLELSWFVDDWLQTHHDISLDL